MKQKLRVLLVLLLFLGMGIGAAFMECSEAGLQGNKLIRGEPGDGMREETLYYELEQGNERYELELQLAERQLNREEWEELLGKAKEEAEQVFLGDNVSPEHVTTRVELCESLQEGMVQAAWRISPDDLIDPEGNIQEEGLDGEKGTLATVTAELSCGEYRAEYEFPVCIYPAEKSRKELLAQKIQDYVNRQEASLSTVELPEEVDGERLSWHLPRSHILWIFLGLGIVAAACVALTEKERQRRAYKQRSKALLLDYPDIVSQLGLLMEAGMSLPAAWKRLAENYEERCSRHGPRREGYEEMLVTLHELQDGVGERQALERFGERCGNPQYRRFASVLTQNLRKGTDGIGRTLSREAEDAFIQRKNLAQKLGEEAGTKLLFPMMLMLVVVMVILIVPACMTIQI